MGNLTKQDVFDGMLGTNVICPDETNLQAIKEYGKTLPARMVLV